MSAPVLSIVTEHVLPFSPGCPVDCCWSKDAKIAWAAVSPAHPDPQQALAEALDEISLWIDGGGRLQDQAELWGVMPPEALHAQLVVWLARIERDLSDAIAEKYAAIGSAA